MDPARSIGQDTDFPAQGSVAVTGGEQLAWKEVRTRFRGAGDQPAVLEGSGHEVRFGQLQMQADRLAIQPLAGPRDAGSGLL